MAFNSRQKHCYAVIAAKKRGAKRYGLILRSGELQRLLAARCPIYRQQRCKNMGEASAVLEKLSAQLKKGEPERISFEQFLNDGMQRTEGEAGEGVLCFYDSEFGMYNYGDKQGDLVSMGAIVLPRAVADTDKTAADSKTASDSKADAESKNTETSGQEDAFRFAALIRTTDREQLAERFQMFTRLSPEALSEAPPFEEVYSAFRAFLSKHKVDVIYCLGNNDQERLGAMLERYGFQSPEDRAVLMKFRNFQRWLRRYDERIAGCSLECLKELCGVEDDNLHEALSDAISLARVYQSLSKVHPGDREIAKKLEDARLRSRYRKSRRISYERLSVPDAVIAQKDALVAVLQAENQKSRAVPPLIMQAICDDLDALLS